MFNLKAQIRHMAGKDVLLNVFEKFVSPYINLTPTVKEDPEGNKLPALGNLSKGYIFEELILEFNEENNEEASEHFTLREVIELMTHLVFDQSKITCHFQSQCMTLHVVVAVCFIGVINVQLAMYSEIGC